MVAVAKACYVFTRTKILFSRIQMYMSDSLVHFRLLSFVCYFHSIVKMSFHGCHLNIIPLICPFVSNPVNVMTYLPVESTC